MFGAFRPSAPLSGGLLWKIPWRLSPSQKLRQRRRLRKIDNIVTVLSSALQNRATQSTDVPGARTTSSSTSAQSTTPDPQDDTSVASARIQDLKVTAEGRRILAAEKNSAHMSRRHGKGPKLGDFLPDAGYKERLLSDEARQNGTIRLLERWKAEMPREEEMLPRDKYTIFDRKARGYRKGVHKLPKWTRVSQRLNPPGF